MSVGGIFARCIGIPVLFALSILHFLNAFVKEADLYPEVSVVSSTLWGVALLGAAVAWCIESYLLVKGKLRPPKEEDSE